MGSVGVAANHNGRHSPVQGPELTGQRLVTVPQEGQHPSGPVDSVGGRRSGTTVTIRGRLDIAAEAGPAEGGDVDPELVDEILEMLQS